MGTQTVKPNAATALTANTFTRADYDFTGWHTAKDGTGTAYGDKANITTNENVTLYAQWTLHKYHVRWLNWDDTVLQKGDYTCEDTAGWDDLNNETPSRPEDENFTYVYAMRWPPYDETKGIDGWGFNPHEDVDFRAVFNEFKKLTVTFNANGGIGTMDSVKIVNGGSGEYYTLPECGITSEGYDFAGWLITGTVGYDTFETYELHDEKWDDEMLLAFSDLTLKASWKDNHSLTEVRGSREPTCTEEGYTGDTYCKVCDKVQKPGKSIPAKGHSWNEGVITTAATCENAGAKTYTCTVCNATKTEAIDATGHTPVEVAEQPATCTEAGHKAGTKCSVCEAILSGMEEIPTTGHTEVIDAAKAPTCTETGLTEGKHCYACGEVITAQETVPAKGHTEVVDPVVEATCTKPGKTEGKHCSVCNEVLVAQKVVSAKGHDWDSGKILKQPTYGENGEMLYTCAICDEYKTEIIPKLVNGGGGTGGAGGGSSSAGSTTKTETTINPDESTTKTETKPDGTVVETTTGKDGSTSKTTTKKDGSSVTESKTADGTTGTVKTDKDGKTEAEAKISNKAVEDAKKSSEAVKVPTEVKAGKDSNSAPTVKVELPKNAGETKIEIPVSNVNSGTVAVIVHEDGTEEIVKNSKPTEDGVQLTVAGNTVVKIIDNTKDFIDTRNHWSRDEVNFVASRDIFNGVGNNLFGVSQPMTRGMVNTVLARLAGIDTTPKNGQKWYEVGTEWAKSKGITDGTNPEASVTREQLATLLYRFYGSPAISGTLRFADAGAVSAYAQDALLWATQNGIMNGVGNNCVAPSADAQRAQVAAMMARYLKNAD